MRVGVYGGSFHPPHVAHAMVAAWLLWTRRVDEVWLVPAFHHAFDKPLGPFAARVAACRAMAAAVHPAIRVVEAEAELPTPSYTINTLRHLAGRHPGVSLRPVLGSDLLSQLGKWRDWAAIEREFPPIYVGREGHPPVEGAPTFPAISSTEVRDRLAAGLPVDHLVPTVVLPFLPALGLPAAYSRPEPA